MNRRIVGGLMMVLAVVASVALAESGQDAQRSALAIYHPLPDGSPQQLSDLYYAASEVPGVAAWASITTADRQPQ